MIKFTEQSKNNFIQYLVEDRDFYESAKKNGCDSSVYQDFVKKFAEGYIYMMENEDVPPLSKRYLDVSYYTMDVKNGREFIVDMDACFDRWSSDCEEGAYENY